MAVEQPQAIDWPQVTIGGETYTLRFSYAAQYQLTLWKKTLADATAIELGAAMAGTFSKSGKWRSAGFECPMDLADLMQPGDEGPLIEGVLSGVKKAYPEVEVSARPVPEMASATKTDGSMSGPSEPAQAA